MVTRRTFLSRGSLGVAALAGSAFAIPGDGPDKSPDALPDGSASRGMINDGAEKAVERGLQFLDRNRRGGSFGTRAYQGNVAVSALGGLAFLAAGNQPDRGKYGRLVTDTLRFILSHSQTGRFAGYLHNPAATPHGPMYGHGFAALFLGEAYGMTHQPSLRDQLRDKLRLSLKLICDSQNQEGGWRYHPNSPDADLSVTVCQIMALRSARNAGFAVPARTVDHCIRYVKDCQDKIGGWFRYMRQGGGPRDAFARTGAGLAALYSAGVYSGDEIERGLKYLANCKPTGANIFLRPDMQYYYGHYYAAQAMWTAGGQWWQDWFPAIREELVGRQQQDGSWDDAIDAHYATAMACIILQIPNNYLPILQK